MNRTAVSQLENGHTFLWDKKVTIKGGTVLQAADVQNAAAKQAIAENPVEQKYLWSVELPADVVELVAEVDRRLPEMGIQYNTRTGVYFNKDNAAQAHFRAVTGLPNLSCHYSEVKENAVKIIFAHTDDGQMDAVIRLLQEHPRASEFDFIRSERILYEILPKGVSKGNALCNCVISALGEGGKHSLVLFRLAVLGDNADVSCDYV